MSSVATDPPGTPVAPCIKFNLELERERTKEEKEREKVLHLFRCYYTHTQSHLFHHTFLLPLPPQLAFVPYLLASSLPLFVKNLGRILHCQSFGGCALKTDLHSQLLGATRYHVRQVLVFLGLGKGRRSPLAVTSFGRKGSKWMRWSEEDAVVRPLVGTACLVPYWHPKFHGLMSAQWGFVWNCVPQNGPKSTA